MLIFCAFIFLFPDVDLIEDYQSYYEIYSVLLLIHTIAMGLEMMCNFCSNVFGCDVTPHFHLFLIT